MRNRLFAEAGRTMGGLLLAGLLLGAEAAEMPREVTLTSGRVLRNVQVLRWESARVVLKHSAGSDPIAFALFKVPAPADLPAMREEASRAPTASPPPPLEEEAGFVVSGQAFDRGMDQPYKFISITVGIYPAGQEFQRIMQANFNEPLPEALQQTTTDPEGRFSLSSARPGQVLHARAVRSYRNGVRAVYEWTVPLTGPANLVLDGASAKITPVGAGLIR